MVLVQLIVERCASDLPYTTRISFHGGLTAQTRLNQIICCIP